MELKLPTPRDVQRLAFECEISTTELYRRAGLNPSGFNRWKKGGGINASTIRRLYDTAKSIMELRNGEAEKANVDSGNAS